MGLFGRYMAVPMILAGMMTICQAADQSRTPGTFK